ncbi:GAF domain-containing protein [Burkholderia vietnamiensis]|uniref:GAF domain-containing protein n=1 Tax=Burkholderia vietnamiensis TaxID=60552 RepID=UPI001D141610|nr:GAF domain-containing protein [Burkholderia vietnamiensis]UEC01690.1 GAF domain-containing protein [Burkholderia vietnamiensis]
MSEFFSSATASSISRYVAALATCARQEGAPDTLLQAIADAARNLIGCKLFTVMVFDAERFTVTRVFTSAPQEFPLGQTKQKTRDGWAKGTLMTHQVNRMNTFDEISRAFEDGAILARMGIGAMLNVPVVYAGRCLGTMNLSHEAGWFTLEHERIGLVLAAFLAPTLLLNGNR